METMRKSNAVPNYAINFFKRIVFIEERLNERIKLPEWAIVSSIDEFDCIHDHFDLPETEEEFTATWEVKIKRLDPTHNLIFNLPIPHMAFLNADDLIYWYFNILVKQIMGHRMIIDPADHLMTTTDEALLEEVIRLKRDLIEEMHNR